MHFSLCKSLYSPCKSAFPETNLMLCTGHNMGAKNAWIMPHGSCPCTSSERLAAPCCLLKAWLSIRFRQKTVNQWVESVFQTLGSKLYPKSLYSSPATPDCFQSQHLSVPQSPPQSAVSRATAQNIKSNCSAL